MYILEKFYFVISCCFFLHVIILFINLLIVEISIEIQTIENLVVNIFPGLMFLLRYEPLKSSQLLSIWQLVQERVIPLRTKN